MTTFSYQKLADVRPQLGLLALQSDETIEDEFRKMLPLSVGLNISRVPSDPTVTLDTLNAMRGRLTGAASLFPHNKSFDVIGYGCTSATAKIGPETVAQLIRDGADAHHVTQPVSGLIAACRHLGLTRLAFLSPYIETVSAQLRHVLSEAGIQTPVFGSFDEADEASVARIDQLSLYESGQALARGAAIDGLFLSCTNLKTLQVIPEMEASLGIPVLSSNLVLAWHMLQSANAIEASHSPRNLIAGI